MVKASIGLTPILEDFDDLQLSSTKKGAKDDFELIAATSTQMLHIGKLTSSAYSSNLVLGVADANPIAQTSSPASQT